jgi:hypothetical protein
MSEYRYRGVGEALERYFTLKTVLGKPGSFPLKPDDVRPTTRSSADSATLIEWIDLSSVIAPLSDRQKAVLFVEYTRPDIPIAGPRGGLNKLEELRSRCGIGMDEDTYIEVVTGAVGIVRNDLEYREWIPPSRRKRS